MEIVVGPVIGTVRPEAAPPLEDAFAVPALLLLETGLAETWVSDGRSEASVLGLDIVVDIFRFPDRSAAPGMLARLQEAFVTKGHATVLVGGTGAEFSGPVVVLKEPRVQEVDVEEDPTEEVRKRHALTMRVDRMVYERFSRLIGRKFRLGYSRGLDRPPFPEDGQTLNFFLDGRPPGLNEFRTPVRELFGLKVWEDGTTRNVRSPSYGRGRLIEGEGVPLFQAIGSNVYQLCLVYYDTDPSNRTPILEKLMGVLYADLVARHGVASTHEITPPSAEDLERFGREAGHGRLEATRKELKTIDNEIVWHQAELTKKIRDRATRATTLRALENEAAELESKLTDEYEALRRLDGVAAFRVDADGLLVETYPIALEHDGRRFPLGSFRLFIAMDGRVDAWNEAPRHPKGHHHPHVDKKNLACFGTVSVPLAKLTAAWRLTEAVRLLLRWLRSYNPETTLVPIEEWPSEEAATVAAIA